MLIWIVAEEHARALASSNSLTAEYRKLRGREGLRETASVQGFGSVLHSGLGAELEGAAQ